MGKESISGAKFYRSVGYKSVTVHLPKNVHTTLVRLATKEDRSLQKTIRRILIDYTEGRKITKKI